MAVLFGYPISATQDNWLHECICETVGSIHRAIDQKTGYPGWPNILPLAHRATLESRTGLRDRLKKYNGAVRKLSKGERDRLIAALESQNRVAELLSGVVDCALMDALPTTAQKPVADLFAFAFELLEGLGVRYLHYQAIYSAIADHVCPFCGTEYFDDPSAKREALDHYLTRSKYPFVAVNLRNLVPMGHKCNSAYKLAVDLLRRPDGTRRVAFDPYTHAKLSLSLDSSSPFDGVDSNTPRWEIQFEPDTPAVATWDEVFSVRLRYQRDHLNDCYQSWLRLFAKAAKRGRTEPKSDAELIDALRDFELGFEEAGVTDRAFLKAAVFRMLRRHCEMGHRRLLDQLHDLVSPNST